MLCYFGLLKMGFQFVRDPQMEGASGLCSKCGGGWRSCRSRFQTGLDDVI